MMKPGLSVLLRSLLAGLLCVSLLFCCAFGRESFLGPGLSAAAVVHEGTVTATDIDIMVPPAVSAAASSTKYTNILAEVCIAAANVRNLSFYINNTTSVALKFYDSSTNADAYVIDAATNQLDVSYTPFGGDASGTEILQCAYNTTAAVTTAMNAISTDVDGGFYTDLSPITVSDEDVISTTKVQMGDINGDGTVNASDAQKALQAGAGTVTLTHAQFLAGDVNRDGTVDSADALKINQYAVNKILSFWGTDAIVAVTAPSEAPVTSGDMYCLKNIGTGKYLIGYPSSGTVGVNTKQPGSQSYSTNFTVTYGSSGLCTVKSVANNQYLGVNAAGDLVYAASPTGFSRYWYVAVSGSGYFLVNYAYPDRLLTKDGELARDVGDAVWKFETVVTLRYYYNYGYRYRYWKENLASGGTAKTSTAVDTAVVSQLQGYQNQIGEILTDVFGVSVTLLTPSKWCSYEDLCYAPDSTPSFAEMSAAIGDAQVVDETADGLLDNDACNHATNTQCKNHTTHHHRNASAGLDYLKSKKSATNTQIYLLTSGYEPCHTETGSDGTTVTHGYGTIAGLANSNDRVAGAYHSSSGNTYKNTLVALHEVSHCLGAGGKADTDHGNCVMSYNCSYSTLSEHWQHGNYRDLYCDDCYNAIVDYLKRY